MGDPRHRLVVGIARLARRVGTEYVLELGDGREVRGERLLVATGRRPRVAHIGLETVGIAPDPRGIRVDERGCAGDRLWAIGDVTGTWPLTHVGKYEGDVVAANILGTPRTATYTDEYEGSGFLTLVSDGERLTGAYALGPEAGEWLQQATLAIRAGVPLDVLRDTIQPFPTFSEAYLSALQQLP